MESATLTRESTHEQASAGLNRLTHDDLARLRRLNDEYQARFGFPFILAVRGPRGQGLAKDEIIATFERRLQIPEEVDADKIEAAFKKGVLTVTLPKKAEAQKPAKKIEVKAA